MKRIFQFGLVAAVVSCGSMGLAQSTIQEGEFQIGSDLTYPPYNYFDDNNQPAGFDVEFMTELAQRAGLNVVFADTRFENLILGLKGGQFDVIASTLYVKPERAEIIDYIPYMKTGVSIAVAGDGDYDFATPEDLCGSVVGSIKGAAWLDEFASMNEGICVGNPIDSREFPTSPEVTQALLSGGVDAQVEDSAVLGNAINNLGDRLRISSTEQFYPVIVGLGIRQGNTELAKVINQAIADIDADGTYDAILAKYNVERPSDEEFRRAVGE